MQLIIQAPQPVGEQERTCHNEGCEGTFKHDDSMGFSVGISHYTRDGERSYVQVHEDQHCCSHECAVTAIKTRIDSHKSLAFGVYVPSDLNPSEDYPHALVQSNAEYHDSPLPWGRLPKSCCVTGADLSNASDIYVPHVDYARPGVGGGDCYQAILQRLYPGCGLDAYMVACGTLEDCILACHALVDFLSQHKDYRGKNPNQKGWLL